MGKEGRKDGKNSNPTSSVEHNLLMLFLLNAGISLSMESVNALFPLYVESLGASILEVGLLLSVSGFLSTALMLPSGWMSDKFGRRLMLILSVILAAFPPLLYTQSTDWRQLIPWAMIFSSSFAIFIPARMVYVADLTESRERARMYGYMNLAWPIGSLFGPTVAGFLAEIFGFHYPFYFAAIVSFLSLLPALSLTEKPIVRAKASIAPAIKETGFGISSQALRTLLLLTLYQLFLSAGIGTTHSLLSIYITEVFNLDKLQVGLFLSTVGASLFGSQLLGGWAGSKLGLKKVMVLCLAIIPPLYILCAVSRSYEFFSIAYVGLYAAYSMTWPASVAMLMDLVDRSKWGLATGIRQTGVRLGFTIGPALGGALWQVYGAMAPFCASAMLITLSIFCLAFIEVKD
ncbi:MAG: MFS transporter [Candidatus Bathyarchaeia archaeon]